MDHENYFHHDDKNLNVHVKVLLNVFQQEKDLLLMQAKNDA